METKINNIEKHFSLAPHRYNIIVFYDAQNFNNIKHFDTVMQHTDKYGTVTAIRVYNDFIGKDNPWKQLCYKRGMMPCQITSPKKNTADLLITIDALKLAYINDKDIICFVTNDSDFYPISLELKQRGIKTMLITSKSAKHTATLDKEEEDFYFTYVERIDFAKATAVPIPKDTKGVVKEAVPKEKIDDVKVRSYIASRYTQLKKDEDNWASYSAVCSSLKKKYGELDYKSIGAKDRKDFFVKNGYEVNGFNFRQKKK